MILYLLQLLYKSQYFQQSTNYSVERINKLIAQRDMQRNFILFRQIHNFSLFSNLRKFSLKWNVEHYFVHNNTMNRTKRKVFFFFCLLQRESFCIRSPMPLKKSCSLFLICTAFGKFFL